MTDGPFYDDLSIGEVFDAAPRRVLTDGLSAAHHAIIGGRLRLPFDPELSTRVTGNTATLASPALVWDIAIGQSTLVTRHAVANLFYRGLVFRRSPSIGDTLQTTTSIVGLRSVAPKTGRPPRGLVIMRIRTTDQAGRPVLDFHRCAMLPARAQSAAKPQGEVDGTVIKTTGDLGASVRNWDLRAFPRGTSGSGFAEISPGDHYNIADGDVVSSAPELARLTMNLAAIHHDRTAAAGGRLVYGGHTIGIALSQLTRALPSLVTIVGWHDCDHLGPVREGDTLHSEITVERCEPLPDFGGLVHLRSQVRATGLGDAVTDVLDWRLVGVLP